MRLQTEITAFTQEMQDIIVWFRKVFIRTLPKANEAELKFPWGGGEGQ